MAITLRIPPLLTAALLFGAAFQNVADLSAQHPRRDPVVEAVQKTRGGVVTIKVPDRNWTAAGVIIDERGYVVTNRHVLGDKKTLKVLLLDGTELSGQVLSADPATDLAIVRIKSDKPLKAIPLAPASDLMVGERVIAVGHPFGYTNTVSTGVVSALGREIALPTGEVLSGLIQTDASINPGNSGGPLLNINGEMIGINVALRAEANGIAFAVNADTIDQVCSKHLSARKMAGIEHGLSCRNKAGNDGEPRPCLEVADVAQQSPAAVAGVKRGDVIVRIGERSIANRFDVERAFWEKKPGDEVLLRLLHAGQEVATILTLRSQTDATRKK